MRRYGVYGTGKDSAYPEDCRRPLKIRQGECQRLVFPENRQHVKEEIAQEAAAAGMTVEEYAANGYEPYSTSEPEAGQTAEKSEPEKADTPAQEGAAAEKADAPEQAAQTADKPLTDIQKKAVEIAGKYENLPLQDKIGIVAQAFSGTEGKIETSPCTGKWRGTSDISIKANPLKHVEDTIEQNDNSFDGIINNTPTPTADELEAKARSGGQISLAEYAAALKAEKEQGKKAEPGKKPEKKPSIRAQLKADKERAAQKKQARSKSQDLERS